jgi:hypothetical protein
LGVDNAWLGVFRRDAPLPIDEVSEEVMGLAVAVGALGVWVIGPGLAVEVGLGAASGGAMAPRLLLRLWRGGGSGIEDELLGLLVLLLLVYNCCWY